MKNRRFSHFDGINLVLAGLTALLWWANQIIDQTPLSGKPLLKLQSDQITEIRLIKNKRLQLRLQRNDNLSWSITHPFVEPAARKKVNLLLAISAARSTLQLNASQKSLSDFGFTTADLQLFFNQKSIKFGGLNELSGQRYALSNKHIFLIDDTYYRIASMAPRHYRKPEKMSPRNDH